ncbi:unnamed protein product [Rotaria magnacalcarata]|uniref:F-box domain-containing protein n=1 Tax=Rotaria magnacalcarata TaxID=392030 RepID=A0A815ZNW1_9BILA|nr:unnamed protein product [Rotaria magnacalcarata]CAF1929037.1 unnamed protein product [Rotaria magnacalcarata]
MNKSTLESLPNEVFLIIFGYLSSFDLCQAFLDVKNARIEHLLTSMRHSLDVSSMHYDQLCQFLSERNDHTNHFPALIHTPVLRDSSACHNFYPNELIKLFHNMRPLNWPNTVQLTLSIQHPSELALLLKRDALPAIEHLNITNEEMRTARPLRQHEPIFNFANMNCVK